MSAGPHILGGEVSAALAGEEQQNHQNGDATRRRASMTMTYPSPSILLPSSNKQQRRASTGTAPADAHAHNHPHERRVSFSGTYRVREYQIGEAEREMKLQAQRDSNQARKERKQMRQEQLWRELAGEEGMWMTGIDFGPDLGADASYAAMSADDSGRLSDQIARASLPAWTRSAAAGEDRVDPAAVVDDPLSAERVVSSLFTSLLDTTASPSSPGGAAGSNNGGKPRHMRQSSHDGISSSTVASTSNINTNTLPPSPRAVNQRRSSLELWSAASQRRASATATTTVSANHKPMEGLAQLRLMSAASRRLSASAAAPTTTGVAEPPPPSFTVPLNDADASGGSRRRSITTSRRRSLEHKDIVVINGKRIQRRSSLAARRRTSLEMEDEPNAADALDDVQMCRQPSSSQTSRRSEQQQLVWMDPETRRNTVRVDAERARAARRRHSIALAPCYGGFHVETTFTNDTGTLGLRRTRSFDGSILPSAIAAKKMLSKPAGRSNFTNNRKSEEDAGSVDTPDTDPSSGEHALDGASLRDGDDNFACPTTPSCITIGGPVAFRRGSQNKLKDTASSPHVPPLNITCIRQRRRPSSVAPTAKPDPRQRRSSDSDTGRPLTRRTSAGRTAANSLATKLSRESATDTNAAAGGQHQKQLASVLSGVNSQSRRQNSIGALKNPITWHHQEKHEDKIPFARIA